MTDNEKLLARIARNAEKRQKIEKELAAVRALGDEMIVEGDKAGVPKLTLSQAARVTRQTVYMVLLRAEVARDAV